MLQDTARQYPANASDVTVSAVHDDGERRRPVATYPIRTHSYARNRRLGVVRRRRTFYRSVQLDRRSSNRNTVPRHRLGAVGLGFRVPPGRHRVLHPQSRFTHSATDSTPLTVHRMPEETKADSEPHWSEFPLTLVGSPIHYTPERISPSSSNLSWETLQSPLLLAKARSLVSIPHFSMSEPIRRASSASLDLRSKSVN